MFYRWLQKVRWYFSDPNRVIATFTVALAVIGIGALCIARDTEQRQLRAYVGFAPKEDMIIMKDAPPQQKLIIQNFGTSPALHVTTGGNVIKLPYPLPSGGLNIQKDMTAFYSDFAIFPTQQLFPTVGGTKVITQDDVNDIIEGKHFRLYILAHAEYQDIWGNWHYTHFCMMSPSNPGRTSNPEYCDKYNDANQRASFRCCGAVLCHWPPAYY